MGWMLTEAEARALWDVEDVPHGPKAHEWESPEAKAERYEKALRGILAACSDERLVIMLQAVAAGALREYETERLLLARLR